jgi:ABC-2 type transport system ATP-binding protein
MKVVIQNVVQRFRVGFWLKQVQILNDISFTIPSRSVFGFIGANGAGKTTLIQLMVGLRRPTEGKILFGENGLDAFSIAAKSRIGYLPERPYFHDHLTGEGLLKYFGALSGMKSSHILDRIPVVLSAVGMSHARKTELRKYSKGMLQRVGVAQAMLHNPEFLVLDEPMSGLDPVGRKEMRDIIRGLSSEGRTVFFSSHVIPDVEALCSQVALIQKGKLIASGPMHGFLGSLGARSGEGLQTEMGVSSTGAKEEIAELGKISGFQSMTEVPEGLKIIVSGDGQMALKELVDSKRKVLWMNPVRPALESFFERQP